MHSISPRLGHLLEGAAIVGFALISTFAVARIGLEPRDPSRAVGVIFAPWTDAGTALTRAAAAGGRILRLGGPSFVVVVEPERADYVDRIKQEGALLVVDPRVLAACLTGTSTGKDGQ